MKIRKKVHLFFFSNYLPLQIWTLKICHHDISKTITARSFKLGQLIEDDDDHHHHHHHHIRFRARFPLPRVGLFDKSSSKTSSPLRAILRVSRVHI